ncbi:MAG TPA: PLP-dependent aminotransferase family protein [Chloroflexota bacterium]|nr:PLP-dependent aminotransferase family protein [Chloroflexota bacterium]
MAPRYAAWLADELDSARDRAAANPAARGIGSDLISFGAGQPAVELYPLEPLARALSRAVHEHGPQVLPYGETEGLPALRELIAERLTRRGLSVGPHNVLITSGSMQGLHLVGRIFLDHRDVILTEAPTFMGALSTWEHQQPKYLSAPVDSDGLVLEALEEAVRRAPRHPRFLYLMPTFQNPSGVSLGPERRRRLLELAEQFDLMLLEDDPYGEFWFDEGAARTRPIRSLPGAEDRVIYLGTFSKILAPGLRLAYAVASEELIARLARAKRGVDFHTDALLQQAVVHLARDPEFDFESHIVAARAEYKARRDAMLDALETTFPSDIAWTRPAGGFFLWLELPRGASGTAVADVALAEGVAVMPGPIFFPNGGGHSAVRLGFSNATPARITEGIRRLARAVAIAADPAA